MSELILYDLPSNGKNACWSLNPWKTRAALNYKGIPYKTEWIEYPDVAPTLKSLGISPNDPSQNPMPYSIPAVRLPDGKYLMDSRPIADALEELKPSPSLHLDNGYLEKTQGLVGATMPHLFTEIFPKVPALLNESSAEYFQRTRKERFGMPLSEFAKCDKSGETAWKNAEPHIHTLAAFLKENDGPYVAGKEISYADFILGGLWRFLQRVDPEVEKRFFNHDPVFAEHWKAVAKYYERDGH